MQSEAARTISKARVAAALGLMQDETTQFEVACIFGAVLNDRVVDQRARALGCEEGTCIMVADHQDYAEIIESMSPDEKAALRQRIGR